MAEPYGDEGALLAGVASAAIYVVGDLISVLVYNGSRPYSFRDQWISELTAYGSPVRPLMVTVITIHGLLGFAFAYGILRAAGERRSLRWTGLVLILAGAVAIWIVPLDRAGRWIRENVPFKQALPEPQKASPQRWGAHRVNRFQGRQVSAVAV